jgi:chemotaxis family two-component system response regulator Rcp1
MPSTARTVELLLIEDSAADVRLTQEALGEAGADVNIHVVADGASALQFLRHEPPYSAAVRPDLILLDLNLPGIDGREVLRQVRHDRSLVRIPVLVLSSSTAPDDVNGAYDLCANCYLAKPLHFSEYLRLFREIDQFWLRTARLPERGT